MARQPVATMDGFTGLRKPVDVLGIEFPREPGIKGPYYGLDLAIEEDPNVFTRLNALLMSDRILHRVPLTMLWHSKTFLLWDVRLLGLARGFYNYPGTILEILVDQRPLHRPFFDTYRNYGGGLSFRSR